MDNFIKKLVRKSRHDETTDCLLYEGANTGGYGVVRLSNPRRMGYVHIEVYKKFVGPVPEGHNVHHHCERKNCWQPSHLEPRTQSWHMLQHKNGEAGNVCKNGHNRAIFGRLNSDGKTVCRKCIKLNMRRFRERKRSLYVPS